MSKLHFRNRLCLWVFASFLSASTYAQNHLEYQFTTDLSFEEIQAKMEAHYDTTEIKKGMGYKQYKRWEYWTSRHLDADGKIISKAHSYQEAKKFLANQGDSREIVGSYTEMGPQSATNTSTWSSHIGRLAGIAVDPNDSDHIIVGSPTGGVWQTYDLGANWTPIFDDENALDVFSVEISHADPDVYFVGTNGNGVMISTDAGATWASTSGIVTNDVINTIRMHPTDEDILFAIGRWEGRTYKSSDGGFNWTTEDNHTSSMYDLEFKPGNPNTIYISGTGVVKRSTNGGSSFSSLSGPWTGIGAIMMGVTPDDDQYLYALQESSGGFGGLYLSTDGGNNFTTQSDNSCNCQNIMGYDQNSGGGQAPRDMDVVVSPGDKTIVHVAGVETWKSTNSGTNWTQTTTWLVNGSLPFIHADCDLLMYDNNRLIAGTDGGIFYSDDEADSFTDITSGLGIRQFYRIGASETEPDRVSGGSQDNGTGVVVNGTWLDYVGADGMETLIDHSDEDVMYATIQFGSLYKSIDGGNTTVSIAQTPGSGAWVTPLEQDPSQSNTLYQGKAQVYRTTNGGSSWTTISNLTPSGGGGVLREIKVAPTDGDVIYASYQSQLFRTTNGGTNWVDVTPSVSFSQINYIAVHPFDENRLSLALSGSAEKVMESFDGGDSWTDLTDNLPSIGIDCVLYEGDCSDGIFVGMSPGIYHTNMNSGGSWSYVGVNMPNVDITELEIRNDVLYVATYGRGLWKIDLEEACQNYTCNGAIPLGACGTYTATAPDQGNGATQGDATNASWYVFTPPTSGQISISTCDAGVDTRLWVHGGSCGSLNVIANGDNECGPTNVATEVNGINVTAGVDIYIEWDDRWSPSSFDFEIRYDGNFSCDQAELLPSTGSYTSPLMDVCGTPSHTDASSATWYTYVPPETGNVSIQSCGGGVDTRLWVYDGDCQNLHLLGSSDNDCTVGGAGGNLASRVVNLNVVKDVPIYIEWDNRWSDDSFDFVVGFEACPREFSYSFGNPISGTLGNDADYQTDGYIESEQIIVPAAFVEYTAVQSIEMVAPFEVEVGAEFYANIGGCGTLLQSEDEDEK